MNPEYENLIRRFEELPTLIAEKRSKLLNVKQQQEEISYRLSKMEKYTAAEVAQETDKDGKKKYTNQTSRDAETLKRLNENNDYQELKKTLEELGRTRDITEVELQKLQDEFRANQYIVKVLQVSRISDAEETILNQERVIEQLKDTIKNLKSRIPEEGRR
ncbi:hypothetical protein D6783_05245 [Candidatus Woesearchaeota archaeon]|nr:MAG: hypothetical protein D6783_05245 [Candidatus Woesearchaeota archaeon]